jgi:hypothetical protein
MFYLLFYKSTLTNQNKIFLTVLFGSLLYIIIHAILTFSNIETLDVIKKNYFMYFFIIDLGSTIYLIYEEQYNKTSGLYNKNKNKNINENNENDLSVKINLLKNTIYDVIGKKNSQPTISFSHYGSSTNDKLENNNTDRDNIGNYDDSNNNSNHKFAISDTINNNLKDTLDMEKFDNLINEQNNNMDVSAQNNGNYSTSLNDIRKKNNSNNYDNSNNKNNDNIVNNTLLDITKQVNSESLTSNSTFLNNSSSQSTNIMELRNKLNQNKNTIDSREPSITNDANVSIVDKNNNQYNENLNDDNESDIGSNFDLNLDDFSNSI